jgi:DNA helicase-2/ATP-dependent DNA helicase PcrA
MLDSQQVKIPAYSVTSLIVYEECPYQYFENFVLRLPPPVTPAMRRGTSIHSLISKHLAQKALPLTGVDPAVWELLERFRRSRFNVPPVDSEKPFLLTLEAAHIRGRIDLILPSADGGLELVDFKSGKQRPPEELASHLQLPLYALAAAGIYGRSPGDIAYTYYYLASDKEISFRPDAMLFDKLTARIGAIVQAIQQGRFDPAPGCRCYACLSPRRRGRRARP